MTNRDTKLEELECCYSVGGCGPFPISFYSQDGEFFYNPLEYGEQGPFATLYEALEDAEKNFEMSDGGFWHTLEDAEQYANWMHEYGYVAE